MMSGIRGKDTKPELTVRQLLHRLGFRFRLHRKNLPGKPDIVLPKWRKVVFVNGCYWHGHGNCYLFRAPKTRTEFWTAKIASNCARDQRNYAELAKAGWDVIVIWECAVSKKMRLPDDVLERAISNALKSTDGLVVIRGGSPDGER
jgi:DNA mismatch endonuclease, patch repair protein